MVVVPKKQVKLASQRNILKRRIKEAYRLQKRELEFVLKTNKKELTLAILYQGKEIHNYNMIQKKINVLLKRLINIL